MSISHRGANNNGSLKLGGDGQYTTTYYYDDVAINTLSYPGIQPNFVAALLQFSLFRGRVPQGDAIVAAWPTNAD